ncbi:putative phosphatase [Salinarchaeum sp. Harcht-Bsk1]|uniref:HAD family hydrolase n=1 Tax=Salinarchaeum sp. Harcht-Bsk1 TaxID=1333523 RepID=UPI00034244F8|nr:HAD family hydrolase [Salinarchaeum sp. Harcht-Bsk1]AGN01304.1 putative phosphatase [Salinarchaeum sp. Harcht-Bsk1]
MAGHAYDAVLFDLDGTLVAPEFDHVRSVFDAVGRQLDHHFSDEIASRLWHGLGGPRNEQLRELGVDVAEFWRVFDATEDPQDRAAAMEVFDDAAIAADLDVPTALVTHCPPKPTAAVLDHHGIGEWFDAVVSCSDDLGWKPDPGPIEHALGEIGMDHLVDDRRDGRIAADGGTPITAGPGAAAEPPSRALYVGDTAGDVGAAWNAGLDAVHVERFDHDRREHCVLADYRVDAIDRVDPLRSMAGD